jgi:hypothetical protein
MKALPLQVLRLSAPQPGPPLHVAAFTSSSSRSFHCFVLSTLFLLHRHQHSSSSHPCCWLFSFVRHHVFRIVAAPYSLVVMSRNSSSSRSPDDIVVIAAYRSAIGKAKRGFFKVSITFLSRHPLALSDAPSVAADSDSLFLLGLTPRLLSACRTRMWRTFSLLSLRST